MVWIDLYQKFPWRHREVCKNYLFEDAVLGMLDTCRDAVSKNADPKKIKRINGYKTRVVIVERQLLHYRVDFYNHLRNLLANDGIELQLLVGEGTASEKMKKDEVMVDWAYRIPTLYLPGTAICWQPFGRFAREADLVIVMHENKIIYNLWLLFFNRPKRIAFWGHGANLQSGNPNGFKERFKRWTINKVDWWFAYTESSAAMVADAGFGSERTTVVDNAVDTNQLTAFCKGVSMADCQRLREKLNLGNGPIGLYIGSLYKEKRLDFLLDAAHRIRVKIPTFQLLVVGAGPEQEKIENAARSFPWISYLGPLKEKDKAEILALADVMLNPGLVGLGILDSFASGKPMFTTDCGLHSPEISYLSTGKNGVMTRDDVDIYADTVSTALMRPETIGALSNGALSSAPRYTLENMAHRIRGGIRSCLSTQ
jgi:glycosyltransferase involved in cell wall biosynthesis